MTRRDQARAFSDQHNFMGSKSKIDVRALSHAEGMLAVRLQNPNWVKELEDIFVYNMNPAKVLVLDTTLTSFEF